MLGLIRRFSTGVGLSWIVRGSGSGFAIAVEKKEAARTTIVVKSVDRMLTEKN